MSKTMCPKCHRTFDDDIKRYVLGSITNTLKFSTNMGLRLAGGAIGGALGLPFGNATIARGCGRAGGELAKSIGCGEEDWDGWAHKCPYCGHKWGG